MSDIWGIENSATSFALTVGADRIWVADSHNSYFYPDEAVYILAFQILDRSPIPEPTTDTWGELKVADAFAFPHGLGLFGQLGLGYDPTTETFWTNRGFSSNVAVQRGTGQVWDYLGEINMATESDVAFDDGGFMWTCGYSQLNPPKYVLANWRVWFDAESGGHTDLLRTFEIPTLPYGIAWDGSGVWIGGSRKQTFDEPGRTLVRYTPKGEETKRIVLPELTGDDKMSIGDLTWYKGALWAQNIYRYGKEILEIDPDAGMVLRAFDGGSSGLEDGSLITSAGERLWISGWLDRGVSGTSFESSLPMLIEVVPPLTITFDLLATADTDYNWVCYCLDAGFTNAETLAACRSEKQDLNVHRHFQESGHETSNAIKPIAIWLCCSW